MEKCVEMFKTAVFLPVQSQKGIMGTHVRSPGSFLHLEYAALVGRGCRVRSKMTRYD